MGTTQLSDVELIARTRTGDDAAFSELYDRHQRAAHRLAATYPRAGSADDLVHGAFERVLAATKAGAGPDVSFRAYLFVTLRRLAAAQIAATYAEPVDQVPDGLHDEASAVIDPAERTIVLDAYGSLPDRMQAVLWQTEVEGRPPRELAPVLGMTANATAALASRAREKLRQAYLQAHLHASPRPACEPHRSRLGAYLRDDVGDRARTATAAHVDGCSSCRALVAELADVNSLFARALVPFFAQPAHLAAAAGAVAAVGSAGAVGAAGAAGPVSGAALAGARQFGQGVLSKARANPAVSGAVVVASALVAVALVVSLVGSDSPPDVAAPAQAGVTDPPARSNAAPPPADPAAPPAPSAPEPADPAPVPAPEAARPVVAPPTTAAPAAVPEPDPAAEPPPPVAPPPTTSPPPPPLEPPPAPLLGPVVWLPTESRVQVTLTNGGGERTGFLVLDLDALGGAHVSGHPSGCALGLALPATGLCGLPPLRPGETAVVHVPVEVTGPGQSARVTVCSAAILRLDCDTPVLAPTTVALD